ncbi:hypothetical protein LSAT2_017479 [Lamellibrachia satsuma]|nr:hypothetical protein LSAT2_017479 [Lamellibrachia satsuma]
MGLFCHTLVGLFSQSLVGLFSHTLVGLFSHIVVGLFSHSLVCLFSHTLVGLFSHTLMGLFSHSLVGLFSHTLMGFFSHSLVGLFSRSLPETKSMLLTLPVLLLPVWPLLLPLSAARNHAVHQPIRQVAPQWAAWGVWQPCSRSCGVGVALRTRRCFIKDGSRRRLAHGCIGVYKQHKICNTQVAATIDDDPFNRWRELSVRRCTC